MFSLPFSTGSRFPALRARGPSSLARCVLWTVLLCVPGATALSQTPPAANTDAEIGAPADADQQGTPALKFAFREQPWLDVLDWFARQADLSLVVNEVPPGSFTYSDTKAYKPTEALDLLNGVLSTRGFALIRRDRMLICAKLTDGIPEGLIPRIQLDQLDQYGQFELVEVLFPLGRRPVEAVAEEIRPLLGPYGKATPLPQTKQLLVLTTAGKMRAVDAIISSIPEPQPPKVEPEKPKPPPPTLVVYPAKDVDAQAAVEMLQAMLGDTKMTIDSRTGQINAYATPQQHAVIAKLLEQMATTSDEQLRPNLQVYEIQHDSPEILLQQLRLVVPSATLTLDPGTNRLLAFAAPPQQEQIQQTLQKLQAGGPDDIPDVPVVYSLRQVAPETVLTMVQTLFPRAKVSVDAGTKRLVVLATLQQQTAIGQFIEQLETQPTGQVQIKDYPLNDLATQQVQQVVQSMVPEAKLTFEPDAGRLLVIATETQQTQVQDVLRQLAAAAGTTIQRTVRSYDVTELQREQFTKNYVQLDPQLKDIKLLDAGTPTQLLVLATEDQHVRLDRVLRELLRTLPAETSQLKVFSVTPTQRSRFLALQASIDPRLKSVRVIDESRPQELVVWATPEQVQLIEDLLQSLKDAAPTDAMQLVAYPIEVGDPSSVQAVLRELYPDTKILVDEESRRVMVWTTAEQHRAIAQAVHQLDAPPSAGKRRMVYYRLGDVDARDVERLLQRLVPDVSMVSDRDTNSIIAWGTDKDHALLAKTVEDFRQQASQGDHTVVRYPCGTLEPERVRRLLDDLVPRARFVADPETGAIIVWGTAAEHQTISEALQQMTGGQDKGDASLKSYSVGRVSATEVIPLLREIVPLAQLSRR